MRSILVLNPKGGSGKSTIATNIAGYFATQGKSVAIADCDPQASCKDWLKARPDAAPTIQAATIKGGKVHVEKRPQILIIDTPASLYGQRLVGFIKQAKTMVIPLTPSAMDIRAAERFIGELSSLGKWLGHKIKLATIANRVKEDTIAAAQLEYYLQKITLPSGQKLPFMTILRSSHNYVKAAEKGLSIFEFAPSKTTYDREQWEPLLRWLKSNRSLPD